MSGQYLSLKKLQDEWHKDFVLASKTVVRTEPARVGFVLLATAHPCNLDSPTGPGLKWRHAGGVRPTAMVVAVMNDQGRRQQFW
jgi:hypothetical protein